MEQSVTKKHENVYNNMNEIKYDRTLYIHKLEFMGCLLTCKMNKQNLNHYHSECSRFILPN